MQASNAGGVWKNRDYWQISGRSLLNCRVINIWIVQCSLSHVSIDRLALQTPPCHASVNLVILFMTDDAKILKMQHILLIMDSLGGGATAPYLNIFRKFPSKWCWVLIDIWHVTLRHTVFEIFAVKWKIIRIWEAKNGPLENLLTPHLETPKDIATKRGEDTSGTQLYQHTNIHADRPQRRSSQLQRCCNCIVCPRTKKYSYSKQYIRRYASIAYCW